MSQLRSVQEIPLKYRNVFMHSFSNFNSIQSTVFYDVFYSDKSIVLAAPTGCGKTVVFELAILRLLCSFEEDQLLLKNLKIVYVAPMKSLCNERYLNWLKKFTPIGLKCGLVTGDSDNVDISELNKYNLIITTPEKFDIISRKWRENHFIQKIKLFLIDEVHLLNEEVRGPTLEVIISRMKTIENSTNPLEDNGSYSKIRFVAVSATIGNIEDVKEWIGNETTVKFEFPEDMRPVPIKKIVLGYPYDPKTCTPFKFDMSLNNKLAYLITRYSQKKPVLIFCNTRKTVDMAANRLMHDLTLPLTRSQSSAIMAAVNKINDEKVCEKLRCGIGIHHAGLELETRKVIEDLFRNGDLFVLLSTNTLAMGVNLPAHLVIIKSTKCYGNKGYQDYPKSTMLQMIGRAGRQQYDTSAVALILTTVQDKEKYEKICDSTEPLESNLHRHLIEHLNAEIVLSTITNLDEAFQWLTSTFLYIRARKNPHLYKISANLNKEQIDKKLHEMCKIEINKLVKAEMVTIDEYLNLTPTEWGKAMARYGITFVTMKTFCDIRGDESLNKILEAISKCTEFNDLYLRVDEKRCLNMLNKNGIRFPLKGKISTLDMKIQCVIQAQFGCMEISDASVRTDVVKIMNNGERIAKCLMEFLQLRSNCYMALLNTILLAKCFCAQLWENSPFVAKQLPGIGNVLSKLLVDREKVTFEIIEESNPRDIEIICKKNPPFGDKIIELVKHLPKYNLQLKRMPNGDVKITILLLNHREVKENCTISLNCTMYLLVGDENSNEILLTERYAHSYMIENREVSKIISNVNKKSEICAHFISEDFVGIDCMCSLKGEELTYMQMFIQNVKKHNKTPVSEKKMDKEKDKSKIVTDKDILNVKVRPDNEPLIEIPDLDSPIGSVCVDSFLEEELLQSETSNDIQHGNTEDVNGQDEIILIGDYETNDSNEEIVNEYVDETERELEIDGMRDEDCIVSESKGCLNSIFDQTVFDEDLILDQQEHSETSQECYELQDNNECFEDIPDEMFDETNQIDNSMQICEKPVVDDHLWELEMSYFKKNSPVKSVHQFRFEPRKKLSHIENVEEIGKVDSTVPNISPMFGNNAQKSIKWRSPLVYSPVKKYSPKICYEMYENAEQEHMKNSQGVTNILDITSSSNSSVEHFKTPKNKRPSTALMRLNTRQVGTKFPLSDTEYERKENEDNIKNAMDVCSMSFLEETTSLKKNSFDNAFKQYSQLCESKEKPALKEKNIELSPLLTTAYKGKTVSKERKVRVNNNKIFEPEKYQYQLEMMKIQSNERKQQEVKPYLEKNQVDLERPGCSKSLTPEIEIVDEPECPSPTNSMIYPPRSYYQPNYMLTPAQNCYPQRNMPPTPMPHAPLHYYNNLYHPVPNYPNYPPMYNPIPADFYMNESVYNYNAPQRFKRHLSDEDEEDHHRRRRYMAPNPPANVYSHPMTQMPLYRNYHGNYIMDKYFES